MNNPSLEQRVYKISLALFSAALLAVLAGCAARAPRASHAPAKQAFVKTPLATDAPLQLKRVVMLMRHSVRPPTRSYVIPEGYAADPWPQWKVPAGYLTPHGFKGAVLLGRWYRHELARRGVLPASGCPETGSVVVWADTDQRTRRTGAGFAQGLAPDCGIGIGHTDGDRDDPLFDPFENRAVPYDPAESKAAIVAHVGGDELQDLGRVSLRLGHAFERLDAILKCCSRSLCEASGLPAGCAMGELDYVWEKVDPHEEVDIVGPLSVGGTAAESILLEYANGMPMADVGWGRASVADLKLLSKIHAAEFNVLERVPYNAYRGATPFLQRVLQVFDGQRSARLTVLVGHDNNVANVGGTLELHWHVPGYARDDQAINGTVGFELLTDASGARFVRAFYLSQGLRQLRELQPLNAAHPPYFHYLPQPLCALPGKPTVCSLSGFENAVKSRLVVAEAGPGTPD